MSYRLNPIFPGITFFICLILILTSPLSAFGQGGMTPNPFIELEYGYDPAGNVTSIVNHIDPGRSSFMQYDALDRLTGTRGQWGRINYRYDSVGNRVEKDVNGEIVGYRYRGANNQLGSVVHDRNGNIIEDEKHRYVYDSENRLVEVWSGDHRVAAYKYDAFGRRISKTDSEGNTTYYAYGEGLEVLTEFKENALPEHDYIYAGNSRVARVDFDGSGFHEDTFFYHTDHIGSSISVTDRITDQVWDNEYLPYGDSAKERILGFTDVEHQFSSKELDENTGLYYFGARYYNPGIGRFMSVDPAGIDITNPQSWNRYAYVRNNPYTYVDPDGRVAEIAWDAFNIGLGVHSLKKNLTKGNYSDALLDAAGLGLDFAAATVPFVPGGAGSVIKASRAEKVVTDFDYYKGVRELSNTLKGAGLTRDSRLQVIRSFRDGTIKVKKATGDENFIRYYGGGAKEYGRYLSKSFPFSGSARSKFALPHSNTANKLTQFNLKEGSIYFEGTVAPNFGKPGGGSQIFVPDLNNLIRP